MRLFCLFIAIGFIFAAGINVLVQAQPYPYNFHHRGQLNENSTNFINDILFDSKNRVWIGAQTGLYRYDGRHYLPYRKSKEANSIPSNFVHELCEDKTGLIWGGTDDGIFRFSPERQSFKSYTLPGIINNQSAMNILCHPNGNIWVASFSNLYRFNVKADSFDVVAPVFEASETGVSNRIKKRGIQLSADGTQIWAATDEGIFYFDIEQNKWYDRTDYPLHPLFARRNTSAMTRANDGSLFFFDLNAQQIVIFDPLSFTIRNTIYTGQMIKDANAAVMYQSKDGKIWFSSWTNHVGVIDPLVGNHFVSINATPNDLAPFPLTSNFFWCARQDVDGNIWLGTTNGIYTTNPEKELFRVHPLGIITQNLDATSHVLSFFEEEKNHTWWVLTSQNNLIQYNPANGRHQIYQVGNAIADKRLKKPGGAVSLNMIKGRPAVSTTEGTWVLPVGSSTFVPLERFLNINIPITVVRMIQGKKGLYYLTDGMEVCSISSNLAEVNKVVIKTEPGFKISGINFYRSDFADRDIYCSIGRGTIGKLDPDTILPITLFADPGAFIVRNIRDIKADAVGNVWISYANHALMCYNSATKKQQVWDETNGLLLNASSRLCIDTNDNIWAMHKRHFSILSPERDRFIHISLPKGELYPTWVYEFFHVIHNGNLVANNYNDIVEFLPSRLFQKPASQKPDISALYVDDIRINHEADSLIILNPEQNNLRFTFGLHTDQIFFPYDMQYLLEGADKDWKKATASSEAVYNKLPPGKYRFCVKAMSKNGTWESPENFVTISIEKPFYKSTLFLLLIGLVLFGALYGIYRYRIRQHQQIYTLETKTAALEREKATIQYDSLKQQLNPHFLLNSLTSLAGLIEADQEMAGGFLQRMSDMYRYILKNGTNDTVKLGDELRFVQLYIDIQQTRFGNGLQVSTQVGEEYLDYQIAPVTLQNLVENAIKHNIIDSGSPLIIKILTQGDYLIVTNNLQLKSMVETSNKTGLMQFKSLYRFLTEKPVIVEENGEAFTVKIPLL